MKPTYSVVDLFAGCGGLTAGFLRANSTEGEFRPIAAVDSDVDSAATYAANFGDHVFLGSIEDWLAGAHYPDRADVVLGGPPCQGFSQLGKQDVTDQRNALWEQYVEAVAKLQPKFFVLENVREFLTSEQFGGLEAACRSGNKLEDYEIEHAVLDSSLYGATAATTSSDRDRPAPRIPTFGGNRHSPRAARTSERRSAGLVPKCGTGICQTGSLTSGGRWYRGRSPETNSI